jgi:hypothetical protein
MFYVCEGGLLAVSYLPDLRRPRPGRVTLFAPRLLKTGRILPRPTWRAARTECPAPPPVCGGSFKMYEFHGTGKHNFGLD